jgi:nitrogen-specific signal transduction histidine kinase/ActR/RegA family two-component response regulator
LEIANQELVFQNEEKAKRAAELEVANQELIVQHEQNLRLHEQLFQAQKMESLGVLSGGVAHDMNNVLAAIMSAASTRQLLSTVPDDLKAYQLIHSACKRGRDIVKSLLSYARPSLNEHAPVNLHALIAELCKLLESTKQSRIRIVKDFAPETLWVEGNAGTLSSALMNFCLNAMDALPETGTLTLRTTSPEQNWAQVAVEDNGHGMTPEVLAKVMDPFFSTKPVGRGTGLGMSMASGVIKAHGGFMEVSSQPGQGTLVTFRIPRIPAPAETRAIEPQAMDLRDLSILLVDDDEDVRVLAALMFKAGGLQVDYAEGGKEALDYLRTQALPDLIILDQNMPGMDGIETMAAIRSLHPDVPILISSGRLDVPDWECFKRPHVAVLPKPFDLDDLRTTLARMDLRPKGPF